MRQSPTIGLQWVFDADGLEAPDEGYFIERNRIDQVRLGSGHFDWPLHVAEKNWCRMDHFMFAFFEAIHALATESGQTVDTRMMANTFREAMLIAAMEPRRYAKKWDPTERQLQ